MKKLVLLSITACFLSFGAQVDQEAQAFKWFKKASNIEKQAFSQIKAKHILVESKQEAMAIKVKLLNGADFDKLAAQYSKCPSGKDGGNLGYFKKGIMVPEFEKAAFALPLDQVSDPVQTPFGWHLIVVTDKK